MSLQFSTTSTPVDDIGVKFCIHAPAGYGKTDIILTLPGPGLILSAEAGLLCLQPANQMRRYGVIRELHVAEIKNASDLHEAYTLVSTPATGDLLKWVALDSVSEIAERVLSAEMLVAKDPRQAYGRMQEVMSKYIRLFRDLKGKHVYFSAKQEKSADTDGITRFAPMMPGKNMTQNLPHFFDEVFALCISPKDAQGNSYRFLRTRPDIQFQAKDRSGALLEIEEPNLTKIISKIKQTT